MIAAICKVPLLCEAIRSALDGIAEVQSFPAGRADTPGLLTSLQPEAIVVDTQEEAREAEEYARVAAAPLVHVNLEKRELRVLRDGDWRETHGDASPEAIRNAVVGALYGPKVVTA